MIIDTSSIYALEQELAKLPDKQDDATKARARAIRDVDELQMELDILHAEIVSELCETNNVTTISGKSEIRRVDALLDKRYRKIRHKLIKATENMNILNGEYFNLNKRFDAVIELFRTLKYQGSDRSIIMEEDRTRIETKMNRANEAVDY